eukprot:SAG11_NODE_12258_length_712_cov_3.644372_1_plen_106_part_10
MVLLSLPTVGTGVQHQVPDRAQLQAGRSVSLTGFKPGGPTPDESSNTSGSRHASSETVPSPRPAAGPAAASGPGPGPGPGTSGFVVVPRSKEVKPLIDSITGHAVK